MSTDRSGLNDVFDALRDPRRRRVLAALEDATGGRRDVTALAETVAAGDDREQVHAGLVHHHLPKLDQLGYVRWDRDGGTVARGPKWEVFELVLHRLGGEFVEGAETDAAVVRGGDADEE